jgi:AraC-like DNA-binding protein
MEVPRWWLEFSGIDIHDRSYHLDKTIAISFDSSRSGPIDTPVNVQVSELKLHSYNWWYLTLFFVLFLGLWVGYVFWLFKQYSRYLVENIQLKILQDKPLLAYQQLSMESHKDKKKSAVLQYMAKCYFNPELSLDLLVKELGVNSKKVNEILKEELGCTFRIYLNKLRLTEAARLVCENQDLSINEIAISVGYKNITHFNKIFKDEYGCSPNKFKKLQISQSAEPQE